MFLEILKKLPFDFGQANVKYTTKGKIIALDLISSGDCAKRKPIDIQCEPSHIKYASIDIQCTALDVGCRDGYYTKLLEKRGYNVTSIDIEKNYDKCRIINVNNPLPYADNYFDLIWCSEVIEHLEDPQKSIKEFRRVLKPEGKAVLTTPNSQFWLFRILNIFGLTQKKMQNPDHKHFFGIKDIMNLNPHMNIVYGFFPYFLIKFRVRKCINLLSPTFIFVIKK